jgi:subtilisin family serine protease
MVQWYSLAQNIWQRCNLIMKEYVVTVHDPNVWDTGLWHELTTNGLGDNFVPTRNVDVVNERPFNEYCAHFLLSDSEANQLRQDPRILDVELSAEQNPNVSKGFHAQRPPRDYNKSNTTTSAMKNWGLVRCNTPTNNFANTSNVLEPFYYNLDGTGVDVVVVDSGVEAGHPEFAVNDDGTGGTRVVDFDWASLGVSGTPSSASIGGYLGDSDGHGTNCASIAVGNTCGWASGAAIYSIRIFAGPSIQTGAYLNAINSDIAFDLVRAFHLQKIANGNTRPTICTNSWGWRGPYSSMVSTTWRGTNYFSFAPNSTYGQVFQVFPATYSYITASVQSCAAAGVILVGAAGNYRHKIDVPGGIDYDNFWRDSSGTINYYHRGSSPTSAPAMICVGAIDSISEQKVYFSETGPRIDVFAPGNLIMGAYANRSYVTAAVRDPRNSAYYLNKVSGTSQACPQVTGVLACVLQARPRMTPAEAKSFIASTSQKNALANPTTGGYSNFNSLQGAANRYLYMPFNSATRGSMTS